LAAALPAAAQSPSVSVAPHRAIYEMRLESARSGSGVTGADGQMLFEWGDACNGWTMEQRYRLDMSYSDQDDGSLQITFVTWEAKDGTRYRFNVRKLRNGQLDEELRGDATLDRSGGAGEGRFSRPRADVQRLPPNSMFPTAHTIALIAAARAGESHFTRFVFDGGTPEGPFEVTAGIGRAGAPDPAHDNPLLRGRWWPVRLAFFPTDQPNTPDPDYELGMELMENGVARDMLLDYGNFAIRARLKSVEALADPGC
jgi:hypothetical protein